MLKFGIRQAGGCGRRPKNAKPTTKPNVQTQKKGSRPPKSPRGPPEAPGGTPQAPGGSPEARGRPPQVSEAPQNPEDPNLSRRWPGNLGPARQGLWTEAKKPETHYQTQRADPKKRLKSFRDQTPKTPGSLSEACGRPPGLRGAPGTTDTPKSPGGPGGPRTVSELQRPQQEKPTTFPEDPERVLKRSRQDLGSKPGR